MFVTVIILARPELGVPLTPYSVRPVTLSARAEVLTERVVVSVTQFTEIFVTALEPIVPDPFVTVHVCVAGCVKTVTLYGLPVTIGTEKLNPPLLLRERLSAPLFCRITVPLSPPTVPPTMNAGIVVAVGVAVFVGVAVGDAIGDAVGAVVPVAVAKGVDVAAGEAVTVGVTADKQTILICFAVSRSTMSRQEDALILAVWSGVR